jgi:hypothetical protein
MASNTYVNDAGTWRQLRGVYVNDAGTWRTIKNVYVNDAGTWRTVYSSTFLPNTNVGRDDGGSPAEYYIANDGTIQVRVGATITTVDNWTFDTPGDYECNATVTSGSLSSGTTGTWLSLGTTRSWTRGAASGTTQLVSLDITLRRIADGEVINTASINIECVR